MKAGFTWRIALAVVLGGAMSCGCSSTGKKSSASTAGIKGSDKSLRTAVEKDPFPRATPGMMTAGQSSTTK